MLDLHCYPLYFLVYGNVRDIQITNIIEQICLTSTRILDMMYRWLKNQKDGSGLSLNINAGDGYELNAKLNLVNQDPTFYKAQEYVGPEYFYRKNSPSTFFKKRTSWK